MPDRDIIYKKFPKEFRKLAELLDVSRQTQIYDDLVRDEISKFCDKCIRKYGKDLESIFELIPKLLLHYADHPNGYAEIEKKVIKTLEDVDSKRVTDQFISNLKAELFGIDPSSLKQGKKLSAHLAYTFMKRVIQSELEKPLSEKENIRRNLVPYSDFFHQQLKWKCRSFFGFSDTDGKIRQKRPKKSLSQLRSMNIGAN